MTRVARTAALLALLAALPYWRSLGLPYISDDYLLLHQGRDWGPVSEWHRLAADPLYRCRALSIIFQHWLERWFGDSPAAAHLASLTWHIACCWLVALLGVWRAVGWRWSIPAAAFFAVYEGHQEAVIWYSALPDLQCFFFVLLSLIAYVLWIQRPNFWWLLYVASFCAFLLGLLSKEPAVTIVPLVALAAWHARLSWRRALLSIAPFAITAVLYFLAIHTADQHLHLNDGTFSLSAPFLRTWAISYGRLLWIWGFAALVIAVRWGTFESWDRIRTGLIWIAVTLPPYCFLTYMLRIPSRHTYLPSAGLALLCAAAAVTVWDRARDSRRRRPAVLALAALLAVLNAGYVLTRKHQQFVRRAQPTETLLRAVRNIEGPFAITCFPYRAEVFVSVLATQLPHRLDAGAWSPGRPLPGATNLCILEDGSLTKR